MNATADEDYWDGTGQRSFGTVSKCLGTMKTTNWYHLLSLIFGGRYGKIRCDFKVKLHIICQKTLPFVSGEFSEVQYGKKAHTVRFLEICAKKP